MPIVKTHHPLRKQAVLLMEAAKKNGEIEALRRGRQTTTKCVDCGGQAECWDHRDYAKPLDVEAVCNTCNLKRGSAQNAFETRFQKDPPSHKPMSFRLSLEVTDILEKENFRTGIPQTRLVQDAIKACYGPVRDDSMIDPGPVPEVTSQ